MKQLFYRNRYFFIPQLIFLVVGFVMLLVFGKANLHILTNQLNSPFFDNIFKKLTFLGDGLIYIPFVLFLLFYKYRSAVIFFVGVVVSNIFLQLSKHVFFPDIYRPSKYFELYDKYQLHIVEGVRMHSSNSFPSGHTTTAFTLFFMLALLVKRDSLKFLCFALALVAGYSRIYLSQHFAIDVMVGSILGTMSISAVFIFFENKEIAWMDNSLWSLIMRKRSRAATPVFSLRGLSLLSRS